MYPGSKIAESWVKLFNKHPQTYGTTTAQTPLKAYAASVTSTQANVAQVTGLEKLMINNQTYPSNTNVG